MRGATARVDCLDTGAALLTGRPHPEAARLWSGHYSASRRARALGVWRWAPGALAEASGYAAVRIGVQASVTMKLTAVRKRWALPAGQNLALVVAGIVLGLSLAIRWQGTATPPPDAPTARARAVEALRQSEQEQEQLKATIASLRQQLAEAQRQAAQQTEQLAAIRAQLEQEQMAAGLVPLRGPGVVIVLDDSPLTPTGPSVKYDDYLIHEWDLRDVVNLLWNGGAEAIAINNERLVNTTSIYCVGSTITVNDTRLSPPYQIRAIGERKPIEALLNNPSYLVLTRQRVKANGIKFSVSWSNSVDIPAYSGTFRLRYANAGEVKP
jgi:uncharacterized protein YlxW (UPF0749 family)